MCVCVWVGMQVYRGQRAMPLYVCVSMGYAFLKLCVCVCVCVYVCVCVL